MQVRSFGARATRVGLRQLARSGACFILLPLAALAVDEAKRPESADIDAAMRQLETDLRSHQAALDSLLGAVEAVPESLVDRLQEEIQVLQDRLEAEAEMQRARLEQLGVRDHDLPLERPPLPHKMVAYDMIRFGQDVVVRADETVNGDCNIVRGDLQVQGEVDGDAIVVGGDLFVGRHAAIRGQAIAVGGRVETSSGAVIEGQTVSFTLFPRRLPWFQGDWPGWINLVVDLLKLGVLVLVSGLLLVLVPERLLRAREVLGVSLLRCFGVGLLVLMGGSCALTVTVILLAVTLVGIPAALVLAFAMGLLLVASLLVGVLLIGDRIQELMQRRSKAPLYSVLLGLVLILLPEIIADLLHLTLPFSLSHFGFGLMSTALVLSTVAAGLGALVLSRFGGPLARQRPQTAG